MTATRHSTVDIYIGEHDDGRTYAEARLTTHATAGLRATGTARLNPSGATARALPALADELLDVAASDVENLTHESVHLESR